MRTVKEMIEASKQYQAVIVQIYEHSFTEVERLLRPDEEVLLAFTGSSAIRKNNSMLWCVGVALTNQRLLIGGQIKGLLKVSYTAQSFNLENINAVSQSWSAIGGDLIIDTLGDDIRIGESTRDVVNNIITDFDNILHSIKAEKSGNATQQSSSAADEIKKFKELLDMGIITQEEFDLKKKQLLGISTASHTAKTISDNDYTKKEVKANTPDDITSKNNEKLEYFKKLFDEGKMTEQEFIMMRKMIIGK